MDPCRQTSNGLWINMQHQKDTRKAVNSGQYKKNPGDMYGYMTSFHGFILDKLVHML